VNYRHPWVQCGTLYVLSVWVQRSRHEPWTVTTRTETIHRPVSSTAKKQWGWAHNTAAGESDFTCRCHLYFNCAVYI